MPKPRPLLIAILAAPLAQSCITGMLLNEGHVHICATGYTPEEVSATNGPPIQRFAFAEPVRVEDSLAGHTFSDLRSKDLSFPNPTFLYGGPLALATHAEVYRFEGALLDTERGRPYLMAANLTFYLAEVFEPLTLTYAWLVQLPELRSRVEHVTYWYDATHRIVAHMHSDPLGWATSPPATPNADLAPD